MESISNPNERAFSFIPVNQRESIPRTRGVTEIRGPYYVDKIARIDGSSTDKKQVFREIDTVRKRGTYNE
jgi:hypothetical protein